MIHRLLCVIALLGATVALSAQSDLDAFMSQVLTRRDDNWKKLQQYTLAEDETFRLTGPGELPLYGFKREYDWFPVDDIFVRSPTRADGVAIGESERRKAEERWVQRERRRRTAASGSNDSDEAAPSIDDIVSTGVQPQFVSSAYFLKFKFEPGHYALAGREELLGRQVLRIEYYPSRLFEEKEGKGNDKPADNAEQARLQRAFNKVALITLWIEPSEHQILQYEFRNIDFDFLPGRSMARLDQLTAAMRMGEAFTGIWLPDTLAMRFQGSAAIGTFAARYDVKYHDYKEAVTGARVR